MQEGFKKIFIKIAFLSVIGGGFLIVGCVKQEYASIIEPPSLKCANIELEIHQGDNKIRINQNDVLRLVIGSLNESCEIFKDKMKLDVGYSSELEEEEIKTTIFTFQENKVAKVAISLKFNSASGTQQAKGTSSLNVNNKKLLKITQGAIISQEDKENLIQKAFNAAWQNVQEMLLEKTQKVSQMIKSSPPPKTTIFKIVTRAVS